MRILFVITLLAIAIPAANAQQIYRWVDADGVVHYSDQPGPDSGDADAQSVELDIPPGIADPTRALRRQQNAVSPDQAAADNLLQQQLGLAANDTTDAYRGADIQQPEEQQVLWNLATRLPVSVQITPGLAGTDRVQFLIDNQPIGDPIDGTSTVLSPVYRGRHVITATIVNSDGETVFRGEPVTFYVQQAGRAR